jgi:hypothetical protein
MGSLPLPLRILPRSLQDPLLPGSSPDLLQEGLGTDLLHQGNLLHQVRVRTACEDLLLQGLHDGSRNSDLLLQGLPHGA